MSTGTLEEALASAEQTAMAALQMATDSQELERIRPEILGKKSPIRELMRRMGELSADQRPAAGQAINGAQARVEAAFQQKLEQISDAELSQRLAGEQVDVTLPAPRATSPGALHPLTQTLEEIQRVFTSMGYAIATGPDIETEYNNFDALNIPADHPARDMHDTFFVPGGHILRTHTSPVQIRYMKEHKPPVAIIAPGRVYRVDDVDATHSPVFHQVEGFLVDKGVSMAHLKGTLQEFLQAMFGKGLETRFRPSFFPFTEPSAEVDVQCFKCRGNDASCRVCKATGWLEVLGAGMIHPKVLENVGYDSTEVSGFAFGLGVERFTMLRYGLDNMRCLYENDVRFLRQFA
ncbi:MAG: phenylalanine--tRNA ligase subunit alpha [Candidatus Sumerlaeaceae bacterium]